VPLPSPTAARSVVSAPFVIEVDDESRCRKETLSRHEFENNSE
jgi:hypothetical protein